MKAHKILILLVANKKVLYPAVEKVISEATAVRSHNVIQKLLCMKNCDKKS